MIVLVSCASARGYALGLGAVDSACKSMSICYVDPRNETLEPLYNLKINLKVHHAYVCLFSSIVASLLLVASPRRLDTHTWGTIHL